MKALTKLQKKVISDALNYYQTYIKDETGKLTEETNKIKLILKVK